MLGINNSEILITGGTGSLGKALLKILLKDYKPHGIRIFSRDELKQHDMRRAFGNPANVSWLIGDVRDVKRLEMAMRGVDIVINAAAMKQVPACEDNPLEAIRTNVHGAENILEVAVKQGVGKVMHVSTDKAVYPVNLYGATKLTAEKLFIHGNTYAGGHGARMSVCRYGNVLGSRGSVVPIFKQQIAAGGPVTITDPAMTRFWITLPRVAQFLLDRIGDMEGGEVFIPYMPSCSIEDIAKWLGAKEMTVTGARPGEKQHEVLTTYEELARVLDKYIVVSPFDKSIDATCISYSSWSNTWKLSEEEFNNMLKTSDEFERGK